MTMSDGGNSTADPEELALTLRQLDQVRHRTRAAVHPAWFPLLVFGLLGLASIPSGPAFTGTGLLLRHNDGR
jgi:hypothetical protein